MKILKTALFLASFAILFAACEGETTRQEIEVRDQDTATMFQHHESDIDTLYYEDDTHIEDGTIDTVPAY